MGNGKRELYQSGKIYVYSIRTDFCDSRRSPCITGVNSLLSVRLYLEGPVNHETNRPTKIVVRKPTHVYQRYDILYRKKGCSLKE